jgi:MGT family glycosyltransferase
MARFLFCSYGAVGHVTPLWPVASALRARGHAVGVLTAPVYEAKAAALGLRYFAPRTWEATLDRVQSERAPRDGLEALREMQRVLNEVLVPDGLRQMNDMRDITSSWDVDVVVGTSATFGVSLFAEKEQKVWATHAPLLTCPLPSRDLAPWGTGAQPPRSTVAKARAALLRGAYQMLNSMLSREWGRLRAREGLPAVTKYLTESVFSPFLYMIPSPAEFDFPRSDLPPQVHYVGPCLAGGGSSSEGWKNPFTNGDPLVYCTAGTVADPRGLVRTAIEAVRGQRMNLFVTLGPRFSPAELGPLPPNVVAASFVPQHLLLPEASAVVCNGGSGAVMGTLAAGKPLVIVPQLSDQPENAARCAALGAGVVLAEQRLTPALLRAALEHVLATPSYTAAARRMADSLAATNGPGVAAELLERLADAKQPIYRGEPAPSLGPEMPGMPPEASAGASAGRSLPAEFSQSRVVRIDRALLREKARMQG